MSSCVTFGRWSFCANPPPVSSNDFVQRLQPIKHQEAKTKQLNDFWRPPFKQICVLIFACGLNHSLLLSLQVVIVTVHNDLGCAGDMVEHITFQYNHIIWASDLIIHNVSNIKIRVDRFGYRYCRCWICIIFLYAFLKACRNGKNWWYFDWWSNIVTEQIQGP